MASQTPRQTATYTSPASAPFTLTSSDLPSLPTTGTAQTVAEKQSYLAALRASSQKMQDDINAELTRRMEEDNARAAADAVAAGGTVKKGGKKEEDAEEENYGEEVVEEDE